MTIDPLRTPESTASVDEIRSFLGAMKEKSPEEVLGLPIRSELPRLTIIAAIGTALLLLIATGGTFVVHLFQGPAVVATPAPASNTSTGTDTPTETAPSSTATTTPADADVSEESTDPETAIQAMGIGESKAADPDENPLESSIDDLLKGIE